MSYVTFILYGLQGVKVSIRLDKRTSVRAANATSTGTRQLGHAHAVFRRDIRSWQLAGRDLKFLYHLGKLGPCTVRSVLLGSATTSEHKAGDYRYE
jgi:hypothetical protein